MSASKKTESIAWTIELRDAMKNQTLVGLLRRVITIVKTDLLDGLVEAKLTVSVWTESQEIVKVVNNRSTVTKGNDHRNIHVIVQLLGTLELLKVSMAKLSKGVVAPGVSPTLFIKCYSMILTTADLLDNNSRLAENRITTRMIKLTTRSDQRLGFFLLHLKFDKHRVWNRLWGQ